MTQLLKFFCVKDFSRFSRSAVAFLLLVLIHAQLIFAADLQIDTNTDTGAASGCELRESVTSVSSAADSDGCSNIGAPYGTSDNITFTPVSTIPPFNFGNICKFDQFANQYNLAAIDSSTDFDGDGLSDKLECLVKTNPRLSDTDGDNYNDGREVLNLFTNPLIKNRNLGSGIEIITPEDKLKSADETPYILGLAPVNKETKVYLFEKADFDEISAQIIADLDSQKDLSPEEKTQLYHQRFTEYIQDILAKFLSKSLDPKNPMEAKFVDRVADLGKTDSSDNGLFVLDSKKAVKDGTYLVMAISGTLFSSEKELTIDQTLKILTPTLSKFDNKPIPAEALLGNVRIEVSPGTQTPVLVGNIKESSRIVATWKSNIVSSALLADSLDEEFSLASPTPLAYGEHQVYITAYRQSDGAQSETLSLNFKLQPATPPADYSKFIYLGAVLTLLLILLVLVRRRYNKQTDLPPSGPVTVSTPLMPKTSSSNSTFTTMGSSATVSKLNSDTSSTPDTPSTPVMPATSSSTTTIIENTVKNETAQPVSSTPDMLSEIFGEDEAKKFNEKQK